MLFFFFIIDIYFLTPTIIAQMLIPTEELVIPTLVPTNKENAKIETQPVIVEDRISKFST